MSDVYLTSTTGPQGGQIGESRLLIGATYADNSLMKYNNPEARARGLAAVRDAAAIGAGHCHSYGTGTALPIPPAGPLPAVSEIAGLMRYTDVDLWLDTIRDAQGQAVVLVPFRIPGGLRRGLGGEVYDEWSDYGRLWTDAVAHYEEYIFQLFCHVFTNFPLNDEQPVYYVPLGHEGKGFYQCRSGQGQAWDFDDYAGSPGVGDMGFTHFYEVTAKAVLRAAEACALRRDQVVLSGPYCALRSHGKIDSHALPAGHPLNFGSWSFVREGVNAHSQFMDLVDPTLVDMISSDIGAGHKDGIPFPDDWQGIDQMRSAYEWIRADADSRPAHQGKEFVWMEYYPVRQPQSHPELGHEYGATLRCKALMEMVRGGVRIAMHWMSQNYGYYSPTKSADGGQPQPHSDVMRLVHRHFAPGTPLLEMKVEGESGGLDYLSSDVDLLLLNQAERALAVTIDARLTTIVPPLSYQLVDRTAIPSIETETLLVVEGGEVIIELQRDKNQLYTVICTNSGSEPYPLHIVLPNDQTLTATVPAESRLIYSVEHDLAVVVKLSPRPGGLP